jgi:putative redox protein
MFTAISSRWYVVIRFSGSNLIVERGTAMAVKITGTYTGGLKTRLIHELSGSDLNTAAPLDNKGDGSSFSPTDLCAASLASCMITTMAIVGERDGIDLKETTFSVLKEMNQSPRRIGTLTIEITLPKGLSSEQIAKLERAARACPVHHSLHPDVKVVLTLL